MAKYENRYWEFEEYDDGALVGRLMFTQFYDPENILSFQWNKNEPDQYNYMSPLLHVEQDYIFADTKEDALEQFEEMIEDHINDEISFYEDMRDKFTEEEYR